MNRVIRNLTALASVSLLAACSTIGGSNANNSSRAQFLNEVWVSPQAHGKAPSELFANVYFAPTTTGHLKEQGWWASQSSKTQEQLDTIRSEGCNEMQGFLLSKPIPAHEVEQLFRPKQIECTGPKTTAAA